ncbi:MAG: hypothetical protein CMJ81_08645 [Planctomycetaceae bacterium]|nr:hypothetical protein [Planctomycetaceae bacterium]MBP63430.1 hypothetical protein [Planctomycetaceae bacterium]
MPIEFPCSGCQQLLRTADGTAGKQAQCPECSQIQTVPSAGSPSSMTADSGYAASPESDSFEAVPGGSVANPDRAPAFELSSTEMGFSTGEGTLQPTRIEFGEIFSRTWERFSAQLGTCVLFVFCLAGVHCAAWYISTEATGMLAAAGEQWGEPTMVKLIPMASLVWSLFVGSFVTCITVRFGLNLLHRRPSPLGDMWKVGPYFLRVLLLHVLIFVVVAAASVVCALPVGIAASTQDDTAMLIGATISGVLAIPAIMFAFIYGYGILLAGFFIVDQENDVLESLRNSIRYMYGNKLTAFCIKFVVGGLTALILLLTCGLALVFAPSYYALLMAVIYLSATGQWRAELPGPSKDLSQTSI